MTDLSSREVHHHPAFGRYKAALATQERLIETIMANVRECREHHDLDHDQAAEIGAAMMSYRDGVTRRVGNTYIDLWAADEEDPRL